MIDSLTHSKGTQSSPDGAHAGRSVQRMIDVIGHVGSEAPIVAAILEQIA